MMMASAKYGLRHSIMTQYKKKESEDIGEKNGDHMGFLSSWRIKKAKQYAWTVTNSPYKFNKVDGRISGFISRKIDVTRIDKLDKKSEPITNFRSRSENKKEDFLEPVTDKINRKSLLVAAKPRDSLDSNKISTNESIKVGSHSEIGKKDINEYSLVQNAKTGIEIKKISRKQDMLNNSSDWTGAEQKVTSKLISVAEDKKINMVPLKEVDNDQKKIEKTKLGDILQKLALFLKKQYFGITSIIKSNTNIKVPMILERLYHKMVVDYESITYDKKIELFDDKDQDFFSVFLSGLDFEALSSNKDYVLENIMEKGNSLSVDSMFDLNVNTDLYVVRKQAKNKVSDEHEALKEESDYTKEVKQNLITYNRVIEGQKQLVKGYNIKIVVARLIFILFFSCQGSKIDLIKSCVGVCYFVCMAYQRLSIITKVKNGYLGFGFPIWLDLSQHLLLLTVCFSVILVETDWHLKIPIELDIQNQSFLLMIIFCTLSFILNVGLVMDKICLVRMFKKNHLKITQKIN